jgi:mRNA interferase MazF
MRRGDIYFAALDPTQGADVQKTRPVVIVSNDMANRASSLVTVVTITSNIDKIYPFEVALSAAQTGLSKDSKAMAQQIRTLDKARLGHQRRGVVATEPMAALDAAIRLHLSL